MRPLLMTLAAAGTFAAVSVMPASAAMLSCGALSGGGNPQTISYSLSDATQVECFDFSNDSGTTLSVFGETYNLSHKVGDENEAPGPVLFTDAPTNGEASPGTWAVDTIAGISDLVIVLKQANSFAAFKIADGVTSGFWTTSGPGGSTMGLSHGTVWVIPGGPDGVIPVPAALPLLLGALGAFGLVRRSKQKVA